MRNRARYAVALAALALAMLTGGGVSASSGEYSEVTILRAVEKTPTTIEAEFSDELTSLAVEDFRVAAPTTPWFAILDSPPGAFDPGFVEVPIVDVRTRTERGRTVATFVVGPRPQPREELSAIPWYSADYYTGDLERDIRQADNLLTWQLHGGWSKGMGDKYKRPWDGKEPRTTVFSVDGKNTELATIDNDATTNELLFLAHMYKVTGYARYRDAVRQGIELLLTMQYPTGGWPQVYPRRGNYSDYVTFNDDAMIRVMSVLRMAADRQYPFNTDVVDDDLEVRVREALQRGLDFILKSQIRVRGKPTAWCAQHDPVTYEPREGRSYEHPSISGSESVGVVAYLMSLPDASDEVKAAIQGALEWFEQSQVVDTKYVRRDPQEVYFYHEPGSVIWYRFYDIETNEPIFSGRDGVIKRDIREIEKERREGYAWATMKPLNLLEIARTVGYYENKLFVEVVGSASRTSSGAPLKGGQRVAAESSRAE